MAQSKEVLPMLGYKLTTTQSRQGNYINDKKIPACVCVHPRLSRMWRTVVDTERLPQSLCTLCPEAESLTKLEAERFIYTCWSVSLSHLYPASTPKPMVTDICSWSQLSCELQGSELGSLGSYDKHFQLSYFASSRHF